jgi:hypothetical protein
MLTEQDKREITAAVAQGVRDVLATPEYHCRYDIDPEEHKKAHDSLNRLAKTMDQIDSLRWGVAKAVVILLAVTLLTLAGWGFIHRVVTLIKP